MTARALLAEPRPEPAAAAPRFARPESARERVLALQRTAGNAAVCRTFAGRRRLARQPLAPPLSRAEEIAASRRSPGEITALQDPPTISLYAFTIDDAALKPRHRALLAELKDVLRQLPPGAVNVMVVGHADATGEPAINDPLSARRAAAVARALRGVPGTRVETAARGEDEPFTTDETVEGRTRNRRVDVVLLPAQPLGRRPDPDDDPPPPPPPHDDPPPPPPPHDDRPPPDVPDRPDRPDPPDRPDRPDRPEKPRRPDRKRTFCERHPLICLLPVLPINPIWICVLEPAVCLIPVIPVIPDVPDVPKPPGGDDPPRDDEPDKPEPPRVTIGLVRHPDTPDDMNDRIPPRVGTDVVVTVDGWQPDLPPIMLTVVGGGALSGTATVDGLTSTEIVGSSTVEVEGTRQTEKSPPSGGSLRLVATMGATLLAESNRFAVSAIPRRALAVEITPVDDEGMLGVVVDNSWSSDSNEIGDLNKVQVWELVETKQADGCFAGRPPVSKAHKGFPGHHAPLPDFHVQRKRSLDKPGVLDNQQVLKFRDPRSGSPEVPMEEAGFGIRREVRPHEILGVDVGIRELETREAGRAGSAEGMSSAAGTTDPDPILEIQIIEPDRGGGGGGDGGGGGGGKGKAKPKPKPKPEGGGGKAPDKGGVPSSGEVEPRPFHGTVVGQFEFGYVSGLPPDPQPLTEYPVRISFESQGGFYTAVIGFRVTRTTSKNVELASTNTVALDVAPAGHAPRVIEANNPAVISYARLRAPGP
jgi:outer membrane protein OmpA-like peptidoglycan-associated protein